MGVRPSRIAGLIDSAIEHSAVTLVCAPRGYGKTTALSRWASDRGGVTWYDADRSDLDSLTSLADAPDSGPSPALTPVIVVDNADDLDPEHGRTLLSVAFRSPEALRVVLCGHPGLPGRYFGELAGHLHTVIDATDLELRPNDERSGLPTPGDSSWPAASGDSTVIDEVVDDLLDALGTEAGRTLIGAAMLTSFDTSMLRRTVGAAAVPHIAEWITAGAPLILSAPGTGAGNATRTAAGARPTFRWAEGFGAAAYRRAAAADPDGAAAALHAGVEEAARNAPASAARLALACGHAELAGAVIQRGWPELVFDHNRAAVLALIDALPERQRLMPDLHAVRDVIELWGEVGEPAGPDSAPFATDRIRDPDLMAFHRLAVATDAAEVSAAEPAALIRIAETSTHRWAALQHLLTVIVAWWRPGTSRALRLLDGLAHVRDPDRSPAREARIRLDRATELAFTGSFTAATKLLGSIDGTDEDGRIRVLLAMMAYWRGNFSTAQRLVAEALADHGTGHIWRATALLLNANAVRDSGDHPAALRRAVTAVPADLGIAEIDVHRRVLDVYLHLSEGRTSAARETLDLLARGEMSPALRVIVAVAHARCGAHGTALRLLDNALGEELPTQVMITGLLCRAAGQARFSRDAQARETVSLALNLARDDGIWGPFLIGEHELGPLLRRCAHFGTSTDEPLRRILVERAVRRTGATLTEREREVYGHLAGNRSIGEIADRLGIAASTVKDHTRSLYRRLGVNDRVGAVERMG